MANWKGLDVQLEKSTDRLYALLEPLIVNQVLPLLEQMLDVLDAVLSALPFGANKAKELREQQAQANSVTRFMANSPSLQDPAKRGRTLQTYDALLSKGSSMVLPSDVLGGDKAGSAAGKFQKDRMRELARYAGQTGTAPAIGAKGLTQMQRAGFETSALGSTAYGRQSGPTRDEIQALAAGIMSAAAEASKAQITIHADSKTDVTVEEKKSQRGSGLKGAVGASP